MSKKHNQQAGNERFDFYLQQLQSILDKAVSSPDPGRTMYVQNARTPLFMLEALSRMYEKIHNKKKFGNLRDDFKLIEDLLGAVDYYDSFYKQFSGDSRIPNSITKWMAEKTAENLVALNKVLAERSWTGKENKRMRKIKAKLKEANWNDEKTDGQLVRKQYKKFIADIIETIETKEIDFQNVEADVHELRRKLRWLSIYPQCFRGLFQLQQSGTDTGVDNKYLSQEIIESPFNKMPLQNVEHAIMLDANHFYALSWMIAELGKLKDSGLKVLVLREAVLATTKSSEKQAEQRAYQLCDEQQMSLTDILSTAKKETAVYFKDHLLKQLPIE